MPRCEGLPDGPCPLRKNDSSVRIGEGDLMLCSSCDTARHELYLASKHFSSGSTHTVVNSVTTDVTEPGNTVVNREPSEHCSASCSVSLEANEVLYFIRNKYHNFPGSVIKDVILNWFRDDELQSAKSALLTAVANKGLNTQQFSKKRIGENKLKATVDDIMNIWSASDENGMIDQLPVFCSISSSRVPVIPEELSDVAFLRKTIAQLYDQVSDMKSQITALSPAMAVAVHNSVNDGVLELHKNYSALQEDALDSFRSSLQEIRSDISSLSTVPASDSTRDGVSDLHKNFNDFQAAVHDMFRSGVQEIRRDILSFSTVATPAVVDSVVRDQETVGQSVDGYAMYSGGEAGCSNNTDSTSSVACLPSHPLTVRKSYVDVVGAVPVEQILPLPENSQSSDNERQHSDDDGSFTLVKNRRPRRRFVRGASNVSAAFRGVMKKAVFCVNRLEPGTSPDVIKQFLSSSGMHVFSCFAIKPRFNDNDVSVNADKSHFIGMRVCVAFDDGKKILNPDLWPVGVTVRPWFFGSRGHIN